MAQQKRRDQKAGAFILPAVGAAFLVLLVALVFVVVDRANDAAGPPTVVAKPGGGVAVVSSGRRAVSVVKAQVPSDAPQGAVSLSPAAEPSAQALPSPERAPVAPPEKAAAAPPESAALSALNDLLRSSSATSAEPSYPSGGLGLAEADWQQRGQRDASGVRGWYAVAYRDGNVVRVEKTMAAGGAQTLAAARQEAKSLLPDDAVAAGSSAVGSDPVDLFASLSLAMRFKNAPASDRLYVRYRAAGDSVAGYTVAAGLP